MFNNDNGLGFNTSLTNLSQYVVAFMIPFYGFSLDVGIEISYYKLLPFLLIAFVATSRKLLFKKYTLYTYLILVVYIIVTSTQWFIYHYQQEQWNYLLSIIDNPIRPYFQTPVQMIFTLSLFTWIAVAPCLKLSILGIERFCNGYVQACTALALLSFFQVFLFGHYRATGISGEPRHFGAFLLFAIVLGIVMGSRQRRIKIYFLRMQICILAIALILTLSTSAWLGFLGVVALFITKVRFRVVLISIVFATALVVIAMNIEFIADTFDTRLFSRLTSVDTVLYYVPKDALAFYFLKFYPNYALMGLGAGGYDFWFYSYDFISEVPTEVTKATMLNLALQGYYRGSLTPSAFGIKYLIEYGIVGVILAIFFISLAIRVSSLEIKRVVVSMLWLSIVPIGVTSQLYTVVMLTFLGVFLSLKRSK